MKVERIKDDYKRWWRGQKRAKEKESGVNDLIKK